MEKIVDFIQSWFDTWFSPTGAFSDSLFDNEFYSLFFYVSLFSALLFVLVYYYVINSSRFSKFHHWMIMAGFLIVINMSLASFYLRYRMTSLNLLFEFGDYFKFSLFIAILTFIFYYLFSWIFKWKSYNANRQPNINILKAVYKSIFKS